MLRASLRRTAKEAWASNKLPTETYESLTRILNSRVHHQLLRNELMMVVYPIRMNTVGHHQCAELSKVINLASALDAKLFIL